MRLCQQEELVCYTARSALPSLCERPQISEGAYCRFSLGLKEVGQHKGAAPAAAIQRHEQGRVDEQHDTCCHQPKQAREAAAGLQP